MFSRLFKPLDEIKPRRVNENRSAFFPSVVNNYSLRNISLHNTTTLSDTQVISGTDDMIYV